MVIPNKKGLHARASAQFVRCASGFNAEVRVTREGHTVGGTSIMGLMMLAAGQGHTILIEAEGPEAHAALEALDQAGRERLRRRGLGPSVGRL